MSAIERSIIVVETGNSIANAEKPKAPPMAPDKAAKNLFVLVDAIRLGSLSRLHKAALAALLRDFSTRL